MPHGNESDAPPAKDALPKRAREAAAVAAELASEADAALSRAALDGASVDEIAETAGVLHEQAVEIMSGHTSFSKLLFEAAATGSLPTAREQQARTEASFSKSSRIADPPASW